MKKVAFFLCIFTSRIVIGQDYSNASPKSPLTHSIYGEFLGTGLHGSVGYALSYETKNDIYISGSIGVGGVLDFKNPNSAFALPVNVWVDFYLAEYFGLTGGIGAGYYLNYWGTFSNEGKDCTGLWNCPPDHGTYWTPFLGLTFRAGRFQFVPKLHAYFSRDLSFNLRYFPSVGIRYNLMQKSQD